MDNINVDTEESRRILETDLDINDEEEDDMFTKEDEEAKDNIVKLSSYNFSKSPKKQEKSPSKKKLSRGMSFQTNPMEDDDINFGIRVYDGEGDDDDGSGDDFDDDANDEPIKKASGMYGGGQFSDEDDEDEDDDDGETEDEDLQVEGVYDPREFEHLNVEPDVLGIFSYIQKYKPQTIILDYKLKPFIPDFIPAVGDIDAFIKVAPSSDTRDKLGLVVLDEPAAGQSDPSVLDLQLRAVTKQTGAKKEARAKKVTGGEAVVTGKEVEQWIRDISDLHRSKPPPSVNYKHPMPEVDKIMQVLRRTTFL